MALVPFYAKWLGGSLVALVVVWLLTRRVASPTRRLALRSIATAAALTPQPLWAPGDGGAIMPAAALLVFGRAPVFSYAMGAFPILAVAALFFPLTGWRLARAASGGERLVHHAARRWALVGVILPLLALAATSPFLAFFLLGGPIALWGDVELRHSRGRRRTGLAGSPAPRRGAAGPAAAMGRVSPRRIARGRLGQLPRAAARMVHLSGRVALEQKIARTFAMLLTALADSGTIRIRPFRSGSLHGEGYSYGRA